MKGQHINCNARCWVPPHRTCSQQSSITKESPESEVFSVNLQSTECLSTSPNHQALFNSLTYAIGFAFLLKMFYSFSMVGQLFFWFIKIKNKFLCCKYHCFLIIIFLIFFPFHKWIPIIPCRTTKYLFLKKKKMLLTDQISYLLPAPEWSLQPNLPVWPIKPSSIVHAILSKPSTSPSSLAAALWKPRRSPGPREDSVCWWKRTISASGRCFSSCVAEHVRTRGELTPPSVLLLL